MKRLAAIVLAVGMVVGAVYVRGLIDEDSDGTGGSRGDDSTVRLRCSTELAPVCAQLAAELGEDVSVTSEDAGTTADALADPEMPRDPAFDVWLSDAAWPGIVADNREFNEIDGTVLDAPSGVLGRSPVVMMVRKNAQDDFESRCDGGEITWSCVGDAATQQLAVGIPDPDSGVVAPLASAVADRLGTTDYSVGDFDTPGFSTWFDRLTTSGTRKLGRRTPLEAGINLPATFAVVGALESEVATLARSREDYLPIYPEPVVTSDVVLTPAAGYDLAAALDRLGADRLADALAAHGWRVAGRASPDIGVPVTIPEESGLPGPGVLQALRQRWDD